MGIFKDVIRSAISKAVLATLVYAGKKIVGKSVGEQPAGNAPSVETANEAAPLEKEVQGAVIIEAEVTAFTMTDGEATPQSDAVSNAVSKPRPVRKPRAKKVVADTVASSAEAAEKTAKKAASPKTTAAKKPRVTKPKVTSTEAATEASASVEAKPKKPRAPRKPKVAESAKDAAKDEVPPASDTTGW